MKTLKEIQDHLIGTVGFAIIMYADIPISLNVVKLRSIYLDALSISYHVEDIEGGITSADGIELFYTDLDRAIIDFKKLIKDTILI